MNKIVKIVVAILIVNILILIFMRTTLFQGIQYNIFYKEKYTSREILEASVNYNSADKSFEESILSKNDMTVKLSNIDYNRENGNILKLKIDFLRTDDLVLNNVGFILRVYDNENTIVYQGIDGFIMENIEYAMYAKYYAKDLDNTDHYREIKEEFVKAKNQHIENEKYITKELTIDLPDDYIIKGKINVDLFDLQYQSTKDSKYHKVIEPLGEFKFLINF